MTLTIKSEKQENFIFIKHTLSYFQNCVHPSHGYFICWDLGAWQHHKKSDVARNMSSQYSNKQFETNPRLTKLMWKRKQRSNGKILLLTVGSKHPPRFTDPLPGTTLTYYGNCVYFQFYLQIKWFRKSG